MTTKAELVKALAERSGQPARAVDELLGHLASVTTESLQAEGEALLPGLGKLKTAIRSARTGRNPKTGETVEIAARTTVKFSAAKALGEAVG